MQVYRGDSPQKFSRSLPDVISLMRNRLDQATAFYQKDGVLAVYDVCPKEWGTMYINGHIVTWSDVPSDWERHGRPDEPAFARNLKTAMSVFKHNNIEVETGWDIKP